MCGCKTLFDVRHHLRVKFGKWIGAIFRIIKQLFMAIEDR
ncbi:Uncharacterised protein [Vibrio cholerae]|nr:Uncharacterised protein [Vibrio cholerae]CSI95329.1 Uncharacterised protein [Vibrio cholerae]